jgi:hypothetical protein
MRKKRWISGETSEESGENADCPTDHPSSAFGILVVILLVPAGCEQHMHPDREEQGHCFTRPQGMPPG